MRYGLLADVHANLGALQVAIRTLRDEGVDGWLCAGDVVGYGPHPNECVELVAELAPVVVAGNHELLVTGELSDDRSGRLARETTPWTRHVLREDAHAWIAGLGRTAAVPGVLMTHAALDDPQRYVRSTGDAVAELAAAHVLDEDTGVLVVGHTHEARLCTATGDDRRAPRGLDARLPPGARVLVNPGSVGQSRGREAVPLARFGLLDLDRREVRLLARGYDHVAERAALRRHRLPAESLHKRTGALPTLRRRSAAAVRRAWRKPTP